MNRSLALRALPIPSAPGSLCLRLRRTYQILPSSPSILAAWTMTSAVIMSKLAALAVAATLASWHLPHAAQAGVVTTAPHDRHFATTWQKLLGHGCWVRHRSCPVTAGSNGCMKCCMRHVRKGCCSHGLLHGASSQLKSVEHCLLPVFITK